MEISQLQKEVKIFTESLGWDDTPSLDKFDHLHEELIEMSRHLRYKSEQERIDFVKTNKELFTSEMGDLFFGLCRLANQLNIDLEEGFKQTAEKVKAKYTQKGKELNIIRENEPM